MVRVLRHFKVVSSICDWQKHGVGWYICSIVKTSYKVAFCYHNRHISHKVKAVRLSGEAGHANTKTE